MSKILNIFAAVSFVFAITGTVLADEVQTPAPTAAAVVTTTVTVTAPAPAKAPAAVSKTSILSGVVVSTDATANQVVVKGKTKNTIFDVNAKTNITKAKKEITLSDLAAGDNVIVAYKIKDGKKIATAIKVKAPIAAPKKEEAKPAATPPVEK